MPGNESNDYVPVVTRWLLSVGSTFKITVKGSVCAGWVVYINEVGLYVRDSFDFNDDPGAYFSQPLGFWNAQTGYAGRKPLGDYVTSTFQDYRNRTGKGGGFLVFSGSQI